MLPIDESLVKQFENGIGYRK